MMSSILAYIIIAIGCAAFFSGSEIAFISIKFMKLVYLIEKKNKAALLVHKLLKRPDTLLATTLVGTNIAIVIASALTTKAVYQFNQESASLLATCILTPFILVFGEIIPKMICQNRANQIALVVAPLLVFVQKILWPLIATIRMITASLLQFVSPRTIQKNPFLTRDEIKSVIRDVSKEGIIEDYERSVIDSIFDFMLTKAADIMVPVKEVVSIQIDESKDTIIDKARRFGFTRLPVFEGKAVKGIVNIFDIFYHEKSKDWHDFIRPVRTIEFNQRLDTIFSLMQPNKEAMVAVLKNGACFGILTMEDLIDEIIHRAKPFTSSSQ